MQLSKAVIVSLCLLAWFPSAIACRCRAPDPDAAFAAAQSVFLARITEVSEDALRAQFVIIETRKGDGGYVTSLASEPSDCGVRFRVDDIFIVYADKRPDQAASACSATHLFRRSEALDEPKQLEEKRRIEEARRQNQDRAKSR